MISSLVYCKFSFMIIEQCLCFKVSNVVSTECASSSRLVGTFLSVCALTVLCGLVIVALSRLLLQKRIRTPAGTGEDGVFHCTGKVSSPTSNSVWVKCCGPGAPVILLLLKFETGSEKVKCALLQLQLYFTFPLNSQLKINSVQICDMIMSNNTFESDISTGGISGNMCPSADLDCC